MQYLRGSRHDYDEWASQGASGWSYKDVLPYFIQSEDNQNGYYIRTGATSLMKQIKIERFLRLQHSCMFSRFLFIQCFTVVAVAFL